MEKRYRNKIIIIIIMQVYLRDGSAQTILRAATLR